MTLEDVLTATSGRLVSGDPATRFERVATDSRRVRAGDLFVALAGQRFDGNDFLGEAIDAGAAAVVCSRAPSRHGGSAAVVEVEDTERALGDLAAHHRRGFDVPVVAITGSNGKTTTKELLRSIFSVTFGPGAVLANPGNFNNLIGLPLSLLGLGGEHRVAVLEMGMNHFHEIERLTEIAHPSVGLITMIGAAHLEGVGSLEGVARAKGELFAGLGPEATAVFRAGDARLAALARQCSGRTYAYGEGTQMCAREVRFPDLGRSRFELHTPAGRAQVDLPLAGRHNVDNALAAAACAWLVGSSLEDIVRGLAQAEPPPMRFQPLRLSNGVTVINDSYNANPDSLRASLEALDGGGARRLLVVLGDMHELGEAAEHEHRRAGEALAGVGPALVCVLGEHAEAVAEGAREAGLAGDRVCVCAGHFEAAAEVARRWRDGDVVLVKGSRASAMETVVGALEEASV